VLDGKDILLYVAQDPSLVQSSEESTMMMMMMMIAKARAGGQKDDAGKNKWWRRWEQTLLGECFLSNKASTG
jgi:hypothetical protein